MSVQKFVHEGYAMEFENNTFFIVPDSYGCRGVGKTPEECLKDYLSEREENECEEEYDAQEMKALFTERDSFWDMLLAKGIDEETISDAWDEASECSDPKKSLKIFMDLF